MTIRMPALTATTALVSCLSLVAPGATLAQSNANANAGKDKLPVCAAVKEDVPCREPGQAGKAKGKDASAPADASDGTAAETASEAVAAPEEAPAAGEKAAEDARPAEPETETAEPAEPAAGGNDAGESQAADAAKPRKDRAGSNDAPIVEQAGETAEEAPADADTADAPLPETETEAEAEATASAADEGAPAAESAPGNSGDTPAAIRAERAPEQVEETTVTEQTARSSNEEFESSAKAGADTKTGGDAKAAGDGGGGLSKLEKFAIGAAGLVALDALLDNDDEVVTNSGDRVVVRRDGELEVFRDDNELLRRPGSDVRTETYSDGSTRTVVTRANGTRIVTVTDGTGRVLRRTKIRPDGTEVVLVDDTRRAAEVDVRALPRNNRDYVFTESTDDDALRAALRADAAADLDRSFSLYQVRNIPQVRELMPEITVDAINFQTDSAAIRPREADELRALGLAMRDFLDDNPDEVFLIEGHTDAVGAAAYNLALSDRRAESVALALTEYFDVPPENMVIQGYGERYLRVDTRDSARENRRAAVRRITPLLEGASS